MTFLCVTCSKIFSTKGNLNNHIKTVHLKIQNFTCKYCSKSFGQNINLQKHTNTVHLKERNYLCNYCSKSFGLNYNLQTHIKTVHLNPKTSSMSRLEMKVNEILINNNISFQREVTFNDLRGINNGCLRFDFVIPINNSAYSMLVIEVDGSQHEKPVKFGSMTDDEAIIQFNIIQKHDKIKNIYCVENGYPLLRLKFDNYKYFENQIEDFLKHYY